VSCWGYATLFQRFSFSQGGLSLARPEKGPENWHRYTRFTAKKPLFAPFPKEKKEKKKIIHISR
jgi:hypothetical protein